MRASLVLLVCVGALACGDREVTRGLDEPIAVEGGQFIEGPLPGTPPGAPEMTPRPIAPTADLLNLRAGLAGVSFSGWATMDAVAVAARFEGQGTGYWVIPAGPPDPLQSEPVRSWSFVADLHTSLAPGPARLLVAAIDASGRAGSQADATVCIHRNVPDNGNVCDPKKAPPEVVVTLAWDRPADLDLIVITPDSQTISARSPSTGLPPDARIDRSALDKTPPGVGYLDSDSNTGCIRGPARENVVFQERPAPGSYLVYVNLDDACGEAAVHYTVTRTTRIAGPASGTFSVEEVDRKAGTVLAEHAHGRSRLGTFVAEFFVP